jgi:hypothetical protein
MQLSFIGDAPVDRKAGATLSLITPAYIYLNDIVKRNTTPSYMWVQGSAATFYDDSATVTGNTKFVFTYNTIQP